MKGLTTYRSIRKNGLHLGMVPDIAAARNGSTPLILDHDLDAVPAAGRRLTVAELAQYVDDLAARLSAVGVRPGEHVVIYKAANFDVWMLLTAVSRLGAVPVMLSAALDAPTVGALLGRLDQPTVVTDGPKLDALADVPLTDLAKRVVLVAGSRPDVASLSELTGVPPVEPVFRPQDEPAMITHTSGTTGLPKLVVHTARTIGERLRPQWRLLSLMRKRETVAIHISFVHSRMSAAMALALLREMPVLLMNESDPDVVAEFFLRNRPGFIEALPNSFMEWEGLTEDPRRPFASVKYFSSTFDAMHPRTMARLIKSSQRRGAMFFQIYGQSEVGPAVGRAYFGRSAHRANGRCVGWAMPGCAKVRVTGRDGKPPSEKEPGFIEVAWPGLAKTYLAEQERYDTNRRGEWWRTGDVGYRTRLGCLHVLDREVDMIPGVRSALEVEDVVLNRLGELSELVVVRGPKAEPVPVLCTRDDRPLDRERWRAAAAEFPNLAEPVQIPQAELPRTATLKVQRIELSRRIHGQLDQRADDQLAADPSCPTRRKEMPEVTELERVYSAFEQTARLVGADCSPDRVMPILTAYGEAITEAGIVFAVLSGEQNAGELDYTVTVAPGIDDPYGLALSKGFVTEPDQRVDALLPDLQARIPISEYLVDAGVAGGFKKIYAHFPQNMKKATELADIPSMPPAVGENADFFARHGLDNVAMIAIDYGRRTVNLYFHRPPEPLERETILSMVRESGVSEPSEQTVAFAQQAFRVNVTLSWDSLQLVRIALARFPGRNLDPSVLSATIEARFERFLSSTPHTYAGELINLLGLKWTRQGEIFEFASYYQLSPMQRKMWMAIHNEQI